MTRIGADAVRGTKRPRREEDGVPTRDQRVEKQRRVAGKSGSSPAWSPGLHASSGPQRDGLQYSHGGTPGDRTTLPQRRKGQRKIYKKERASRRLAGEEPEYGMLLGGGGTQHSARRRSGSGRRSGRLSKWPTAFSSEKSQGIVKSRGESRTYLDLIKSVDE